LAAGSIDARLRGDTTRGGAAEGGEVEAARGARAPNNPCGARRNALDAGGRRVGG